ncbi:hypothetical protein TST_0492 [Thermosulfidibacter takaii ABI70S6]|uniref:DUF927 domain-containing protein n=1 Tax=Thermosulfidibacter takaii (strain DSM 17441 / JCM 13301 / NBRC 103674 / ABI70S6) TaxID=1298851 RepID=A0A0S3QSI3_THET7|nr:hypothetical protein [Thermosulfidibacter takaii]BAT71299.1 hypothetical protein TST_0492 [Thermosulfidibacter takaii ABI70S6]
MSVTQAVASKKALVLAFQDAIPGLVQQVVKVLEGDYSCTIKEVCEIEDAVAATLSFLSELSLQKRKRQRAIVVVSDDQNTLEDFMRFAAHYINKDTTLSGKVLLSYVNPSSLIGLQEKELHLALLEQIYSNRQAIVYSEEADAFVKTTEEGWGCSSEALYYIGRNGTPQPISDFGCRILTETQIFSDLNHKQPSSILLEIELRKDGKTETITVPSTKLDSLNSWLPPRYTLHDIPRCERRFILCLKSVSYKIHGVRVEKKFSTTGWHRQGDEWIFVHTKDPAFYANTPSPLPYEILPEEELAKYSNETLKETLLTFLSCHARAATFGLLASAAFAPLIPFAMRFTHCDHAVMLLGATGSLKTSLVKLGLCLFGRDFVQSPVVSLEATGNAVNTALVVYSCLPFVLDDVRPPSTTQERRHLTEKLQTILRLYSQRSEKSRANADGSLKAIRGIYSYLWVTGETLPAQMQSIRNRCITFIVQQKDADLKKFSQLQSNSHLLNALGSVFICSLRKRLNEVGSDTFTAELKEAWDSIESVSGLDLRLQGALRCLRLGLNLFLGCLADRNILSVVEAQKLSEEGYNHLLLAFMEHQKAVSSCSPLQKFLETLQELIAEGEVRYYNTEVTEDRPYRSLGVWEVRRRKGFVAIPVRLVSIANQRLYRIGSVYIDRESLELELRGRLGTPKVVTTSSPPWNKSAREKVYLVPKDWLTCEE